MRATAEITNRGEYAHLLGDALPHVIHTEAENDRCTVVLEGLAPKKEAHRGREAAGRVAHAVD